MQSAFGLLQKACAQLTLVVLLSWSLLVPPALAASLATATDSLSSGTVSATPSHSISFTTSTSLAAGSTIRLQFSDFDLALTTTADVSVSTGPTDANIAYDNAAETITLTLPTGHTAGAVTVGIASGKITSPATAGQYPISIVTKEGGIVRDTGVAIADITNRITSSIVVARDPDLDDDGTVNFYDSDVDGDLDPNTTDPDIDGDSTANASDTMPNGAGTAVDIDADNINNAWDTDIDSDGVLNTVDPDIDGDGTANAGDLTPSGLGNTEDADGDGILNSADADVDGDGVANASDSDIDGDGVANASDSTPNGYTPASTSSSSTYSAPADTTPPTLSGVVIANTGGKTIDETPTIQISSSGEPALMQLSCNGGSTWSSWMNYPSDNELNSGMDSDFNITNGAGCTTAEGTKTISVKLRDSSSNESSSSSASVIFDKSGPKIASVTATPSSSTVESGGTVNFTLSFDEPAKSSSSFVVNFDSGGSATIPAWSTAASSVSGTYTVGGFDSSTDLTVQTTSGTLTDALGNTSTNPLPTTNLAAGADIKVNGAQIKVISPAVNSSDKYETSGGTIQIQVNATGASNMKINGSGLTATGSSVALDSWLTYSSSTLTLALSSTLGARTVSVEVKNSAGTTKTLAVVITRLAATTTTETAAKTTETTTAEKTAETTNQLTTTQQTQLTTQQTQLTNQLTQLTTTTTTTPVTVTDQTTTTTTQQTTTTTQQATTATQPTTTTINPTVATQLVTSADPVAAAKTIEQITTMKQELSSGTLETAKTLDYLKESGYTLDQVLTTTEINQLLTDTASEEEKIELLKSVDPSTTLLAKNTETGEWEVAQRTIGLKDSDSDGLSDLTETEIGTDPYKADSDGDGYSDGLEVLDLATNPKVIDTKIQSQITNLTEDAVVAEATPLLRGTAPAGEQITLLATTSTGESISLGQTTADEENKWLFLPETSLPEGNYEVQLLDGSGNLIDTVQITVDLDFVLPAPEIFVLGSDGDQSLAAENGSSEIPIFAESQPSFYGNTYYGSTIVASFQSLVVSTSVVADSPEGDFAITPPRALPAGDHTLTIYAELPDGTRSQAQAIKFRIDPDHVSIFAGKTGLFDFITVKNFILLVLLTNFGILLVWTQREQAPSRIRK